MVLVVGSVPTVTSLCYKKKGMAAKSMCFSLEILICVIHCRGIACACLFRTGALWNIFKALPSVNSS